MVEITGSYHDRRYALDVAEWCARELAKAGQTGNLETRPFVQNADLIIAALREYSNAPEGGDTDAGLPTAQDVHGILKS